MSSLAFLHCSGHLSHHCRHELPRALRLCLADDVLQVSLFPSHSANHLVLDRSARLVHGTLQFGEDRLHALPEHMVHCLTYLAL